MAMFNPPHPGEIIKSEVIEALNLSVSKFASHLRMSREALSRVINGHSGISPTLAIRLEMAGISNAAFWLRLQTSYDLRQAQSRPQPPIKTLYQNEGTSLHPQA